MIRAMMGCRPPLTAAAVLLWALGMHSPEGRGVGQEPRTVSASPGRRLALAYDWPLPDSVSKAIAEVKVLDRDTGASIPQPEVRVKNMTDLKFRSFQGDDQGVLRFVYPFVDAPQASVEVHKEGYVPQLASWGFDPNGPGQEPPPRQLTIRLRRGRRIGGRVTDEHGRPIEGVTVVVSVDKSDRDDRLSGDRGQEIFYQVPFRTGRDGRWQTQSCPAGARELSLQLIHPDFISGGSHSVGGPGLRRPPVETLFDGSDIEVMAKGVRLEGRVVDANGKPVPGAQVIESTSGHTEYRYLRGATSGEDGRFHLHCHWDEVVQLTAEVRGFAPFTVRTVARPDSGPVEIRLDRGQILRGKLVDPQGKPLAGAFVVHITDRKSPFFLQRYTDSRGEFVWEDAPGAPVALAVAKRGYVGQKDVPFESGGKINVVTLEALPRSRNVLAR
ncbi:MAG: carboxypeptidase-like regulatory domain-containing protein [Isosphaeraceae bacterium]